MSRVKKMLRASLAGLTLFVVVLAVVALVAPRLIGLRHLRDRITAELSQRLSATVRCDALGLSLLPLPAVVLRGVHVSIPGRIDTHIGSVSVSPRFLSLLRGKFQLREVRIESPEISVQRLPPATARKESPAGLAATVESALGDASLVAFSAAAGAAVVVHAGTLTFPLGEGGMLQLRRIDAQIRLPPALMSIDAQCTSNVWERLSLHASIDPISTDLSGQMEVAQLRPQLIAVDVLPAGMRLGDSEANLKLAVSTRNHLQALHAAVEGSIPALTVDRGHDQVVLRSKRLDATCETEGDALHATLAQLELDYPHLQLSGSLSVATDRVAVDLQATDVDVDSARQAATLVAGDVPIVRSIFNVLRGGTVPQITARSEAPSLGALGDDEFLRIQGRLVGGRVHVPGVDLDLENVTGEATVEDGALVGEHVSAQLGQSQTTEGSLRVGLVGNTPELHVNTQVRADAAELAAQLERLRTNVALQDTLERVSDVSGTVSGTLSLDGTTRDVAVKADASAFAVSGRLEGLRAPLHIEGGHFLYDTRGIEARDITLVTGGSRLSEIALQALPSGIGSFEIAAGASQITLDEVYPWLQASGWLPESPWNPTALSGTLSLESMRLAGSPDAGNWHFELTGSAQKLAIESARLPQRIAIHYPVSLSGLHVRHDTKTGTSFSAKVLAPDNLTGSIDLSWSAQRLDITHMSVRDSQSDAALALVLAAQDLSLTFKGSLTKATLDRLIENDLPGGSVRGNVSVRLRLDQPARASVNGLLEAQDVNVPLRGGQHLKIESLAFRGAGNSISGKATVETTEGTRLQVRGRVESPPQGPNVDLAVDAGRLDWSAIAPWIAGGDDAVQPAAPGSWTQSVRGKLRVAAESFSYDGFTWEPLRAVVAFTPGGLTVTVTDATVCGVSTPGTITVAPDGMTLAFKPVAKNQQLQALLSCAGLKDELATGGYSFRAALTARGTGAELSRSLQGHAQFHAVSGRLYGMGITARALAILSMATGAVWAIPDLTKEGLPYDDLSLKGEMKAGTLVLSEATLNGPTVRWAAEGTVDLPARSLDLTLLVAPLKTVDTVVSRIPILGNLVGGSLVSVPVKVSGSFSDPNVTPLSPSAVGKGLLNMMTRTLKMPLKVIEPAGSEGTKP